MTRGSTPPIRDVEKDFKNDFKVARKFHLPGWAILGCFIAGLCGSLLLDHFGNLNLFYPLEASILALAVTVAVKWELRRFAWFWIAMMTIAALHVLLILSVQWADKWIAAPVIAGIATLDSIVMWIVIDIIAHVMKRTMPPTAEREHGV
jgi:uncharacterized membrane protein (DUF485 family)